MNFVLLHHHIFKNAGSTLDWILEKNFGVDFNNLETDSITGQITPETLLEFLDEHKNIKAISSHHFHGQKFQSNTHIFFDILFLRHPLDRLRSIYDFYHKSNSISDPLAQIAQRMCLSEFLEYLIQRHPHQVNDVQVNILANHGRYCRPHDQYDLSMARARLQSISMLGTLEMFDESLVAAEYFLTPAFGELDLSYRIQNTSQGKSSNLSKRLAELRLEELQLECGIKLYNQLLVMNQLDLRLLEYINREVERRVALTPCFDSKLTKFQNRCMFYASPDISPDIVA